MLKYRLISFPLLTALFLVIVLSRQYGPVCFAVVAPLALGLAVYELLSMLGKIELPVFPKIAGFSMALVTLPFVAGRYWGGRGPFESFSSAIFMVVMLLPLLMLLIMLFSSRRRETLIGTMLGIGAVYIFAICYGPLIFIYEQTGGMTAFFYLAAVTKMMDTGGYIVGRLSNSAMKNGNHKIVPSISPGKSYEGALGGIMFSLAAALAFYYFGASPFDLTWTLISGVVLAFGSLAGDLTESAVKRFCGVKDSNSLIPGMGGVFDVLDSFIYNGVLFSLLLMVTS